MAPVSSQKRNVDLKIDGRRSIKLDPMAIHDRDYYEPTRFGGDGPFVQRILGSAVWTILAINVVVYLMQIFLKGAGEIGFVTDWFCGRAVDVFGSFQIWRNSHGQLPAQHR